MRFLLFSLLTSILVSCNTPATVSDSMDAPSENAPGLVEASYGDVTSAALPMPSELLLTTYTEEVLSDTVTTTVVGRVNEVCQAKGCWLTMATGGDEEMMVKFKDYGFFVPKDIGGREVVLNGMAYYQITPVDELRHYAEDAGKSPEEIAAITDDQRELRFLATGVQLLAEDL